MDPYEEARSVADAMERMMRGLDEDDARLREDARRVDENMHDVRRRIAMPSSESAAEAE